MRATPGQSFRAGIVTFAKQAHNSSTPIGGLWGARHGMQALVELIAGFIALLAAAVLSQFGVDIHAPRAADREVHRTTDCPSEAPGAALAGETAKDC